MERVLIAYDDSAPARRALERAARLMPHAEVTVVAVAQPVYRDPRMAQFADPEEEERQAGALAAAVEALARSGVEVRTAGPVGDAADEIVRLAKEMRADVIVLGARGLNPLKRLVLGSVSTRVLHHAPCDVLVVR
jgi:nucleotide-binding universal stress UspA family protein